MKDDMDNHIARILSGEASAEDYYVFSQWINEDERHKEEFRLLQDYWDASVSVTDMPRGDESVNLVLNKIAAQERKKNKRQVVYAFAGIVAMFCLLFAVSLAWLPGQKTKTVREYYTYVTSDSKSDLLLSDGTKIILNKNSRLTYSNQYGEEIRWVQLDGEAYFDVMPDKEHPFEVRMGESKITVLGTVFNVKAFLQGECIIATLVEGSIQFENSGQKVKINPNQQLKYDKKQSNVTINTVDVDYAVAWKDGMFKYKSVELQELIRQLEKHYHVRIILPERSSFQKMRVSGSFYCNQPIGEVLDIIKRSMPLHWQVRNGIYYIKPDV